MTHIVPVFDGFSMPHLIRRLDIAGRDITRHLIKLLFHRGYSFNRTADFETVREIKEKLCYVSADLQMDRKLALETTVLMKDYVVGTCCEGPSLLFLSSCQTEGPSRSARSALRPRRFCSNRISLTRSVPDSPSSSSSPSREPTWIFDPSCTSTLSSLEAPPCIQASPPAWRTI